MPEEVGWARRVIAVGVLALAAMGATATVVMSRADAAAQAGHYSRAVAWRPGVPLYHRELAETLLLQAPRQALAQLQIAAKLDPDDPLTQADLTTVELALGEWRQATDVAAVAQRHDPNFGAAWRLANLDLAQGNLQGFWRQTRIAAARAQSGDFAPLETRALTASGFDFVSMRRALPVASAPAASVLLQAALTHGDKTAAADAARWLLRLHPAQLADASQRREALLDWLTAAWQLWPDQATATWQALRTGDGLLTFAVKWPQTPYLEDGNFDPDRADEAAVVAPDPGSALRAVVGWRQPEAPGVRFYQVLTGESAHPSAAELAFDGDQPDQVTLAQQWILARPGTTLHISAWSRSLSVAGGDGLSLRLTTLQGTALGEVPLPLAGAWQTAHGVVQLPSGLEATETLQLELHYERPNGSLPLHLQALVTGIEVQ